MARANRALNGRWQLRQHAIAWKWKIGQIGPARRVMRIFFRSDREGGATLLINAPIWRIDEEAR